MVPSGSLHFTLEVWHVKMTLSPSFRVITCGFTVRVTELAREVPE